MAERNPFNRRPPEDVLVPEYWDGHGFKDDCGWEKPQKPTKGGKQPGLFATYLRPFVTAKRVLRFQIRLAPNVIQIGVVNHERRNNDEGYTFWDEMIRFKSLDVLRIGQGMPEKDGKEQSIPQLNPVTQEN